MAVEIPDGHEVIEVKWDFTAFPVWSDDAMTALSSGLCSAFQSWSDALTQVMAQSVASGETPDAARLERLVNEGRALSARAASTLGSDWVVMYFNEITGESERVESLDAR